MWVSAVKLLTFVSAQGNANKKFKTSEEKKSAVSNDEWKKVCVTTLRVYMIGVMEHTMVYEHSVSVRYLIASCLVTGWHASFLGGKAEAERAERHYRRNIFVHQKWEQDYIFR